jgi:hypothetical protein
MMQMTSRVSGGSHCREHAEDQQGQYADEKRFGDDFKGFGKHSDFRVVFAIGIVNTSLAAAMILLEIF